MNTIQNRNIIKDYLLDDRILSPDPEPVRWTGKFTAAMLSRRRLRSDEFDICRANEARARTRCM